jgi:hypothetical protein
MIMARVDDYLDALMEAMSRMDPMAHWPLRIEEIAAYFTDLEAQDIYKKMLILKRKRTSLEEASKLFPGPSFIREFLPDLIAGSKFTKLSKQERIGLVEWFFDVLKKMMVGDMFCRKGRNLLLKSHQVNKLVKSIQWIKPMRKEDAQKFHRLSTSLLTLVWSLYFFPWPNMGFEIHGPYDVSKIFGGGNSVLLIRDFFNIKPTNLWPSTKDLHAPQVKLFAIYQDVDIRMDIFNHMIYSVNLSSDITDFAVYLNDVAANFDDLTTFIDQLLAKSTEISGTIEKMTKEEKVNQFIKIRYFGLKKFRAYFGARWQPPSTIRKRIKRWGLVEIPAEESSLNAEEIKRIFDPRDDCKPRH